MRTIAQTGVMAVSRYCSTISDQQQEQLNIHRLGGAIFNISFPCHTLISAAKGVAEGGHVCSDERCDLQIAVLNRQSTCREKAHMLTESEECTGVAQISRSAECEIAKKAHRYASQLTHLCGITLFAAQKAN